MTEEPGGLQSMRSQRVRHNWVAERTPRLVVHLSRWHRDLPCTLCTHTSITFFTINILWYSGTLVIIHEPTSTTSVVHSTGFDTCIVTCFYYDSVLQNNFTTPKILCAPPIRSSFLLTPGNLWSFHCLHHFALPQCHIVEISMQPLQIHFFHLSICI